MNYRTEKEYNIMIRKCLDKEYKRYKSCGGRGITVCPEWMKFENFYKDMGECIADKILWRKNTKDNYYKENCYWATKKERKLLGKF